MITTAEQLRNWILTELGYPLITIELTESQLDQAIDNAFEKYTKYADFGEEYLVLNLKNYDTTNNYFDLSDYNIAAVYKVDNEDSTGLSSGNTIFTFKNDLLNSGTYPYFNNNLGGGGAFVTYHAACEFSALAKRMSGSGYGYKYDRYNKHLILYPTPQNVTTDEYILICCEIIPDDEELYGNEYLKRLVLAYAKIMLGTIRKKFGSVQLIGGATIDTEIGDEGKEELKELIENIKTDEALGTGMFIG